MPLLIVSVFGMAIILAASAVAQDAATVAGELAPGVAPPARHAQLLTPWALLTATAGLTAFHIGLFTLVGRERKSPYIINLVYPIFMLCLLVAVSALCSVLLPTWLGWIEQPLLQVSAVILVGAFVYSILRVYRIAVRAAYFVDSIHFKHWPGVRHLRRSYTFRSPRPTYAHNPVPISPSLKQKIIKILLDAGQKNFELRSELDPKALALAVQHQGQGNELLAQLAAAFLTNGCSVQYLTASRHPIEFVAYLKSHIDRYDLVWQEITKRIVVIDAYSPHFGFLDSIYQRKRNEIANLGIHLINSRITYAGMHSSSSDAFNVIKTQMGEEHRRPTLVIYEDSYALTDLESPEQYRIFVRHVLPSERLWDGMFTVFLESAMQDYDWRILQSYASMRLDLRADTAIVAQTDAPATDRAVPDQDCPNEPSSPVAAPNSATKVTSS